MRGAPAKRQALCAALADLCERSPARRPADRIVPADGQSMWGCNREQKKASLTRMLRTYRKWGLRAIRRHIAGWIERAVKPWARLRLIALFRSGVKLERLRWVSFGSSRANSGAQRIGIDGRRGHPVRQLPLNPCGHGSRPGPLATGSNILAPGVTRPRAYCVRAARHDAHYAGLDHDTTLAPAPCSSSQRHALR